MSMLTLGRERESRIRTLKADLTNDGTVTESRKSCLRGGFLASDASWP